MMIVRRVHLKGSLGLVNHQYLPSVAKSKSSNKLKNNQLEKMVVKTAGGT